MSSWPESDIARRSNLARLLRMLSVAVVATSAISVSAADFPPITVEEKAMIEVVGHPRTAAVLLFERGTFELEADGKDSVSVLAVQGRLKILAADGTQYGNVTMRHRGNGRIQAFRGRTVQKDGTILEANGWQAVEETNAVEMPGVEVGAIIDFEYEVGFDSILALKPWLFQDRIPILESRIEYHVPGHIGFTPWVKAQPDKIQVETENLEPGWIVRATMKDMPAIPDEVFAYPIADLSNQFLVLPLQYVTVDAGTDLLMSWEGVKNLYEKKYARFRKGRAVKKKARALAGGETNLENARVLYRWVRDEIETDPEPGVEVYKGRRADDVIDEGRGTPTEKVLLLQAMLDAIKIEADLVWATRRSSGLADLNAPNPGWFDLAILKADIGEASALLDPSDRRLEFGQLSPDLEGTQGVVLGQRTPPGMIIGERSAEGEWVSLNTTSNLGSWGVSISPGHRGAASDRRESEVMRDRVKEFQTPKIITLPVAPSDLNRRKSEVRLEIGVNGRLSGTGKVEFGGHSAWKRMAAGDQGSLGRHWQEWLQERLGDFQVDQVEVDQDPATRRIALSWKMEQSPSEGGIEQISVDLSRPLGPVSQPFESSTRYTPVLLDYESSEEVNVSLTWAENWKVNIEPTVENLKNDSGEAFATIELDRENRSLEYTRRLGFKRREFNDSKQLTELKHLYDQAREQDLQRLGLVQDTGADQ